MAEGISDQRQWLARISQLPAHHHHQAKAEEQKEQAADAVLNTDHLVIGGENVTSAKSLIRDVRLRVRRDDGFQAFRADG